MKIVYFANAASIHDCKWINHFAKSQDVLVIGQAGPDAGESKLMAPLQKVLPPFSFFDVRSMRASRASIRKLTHGADIVHSMYAMPNAIWASMSGVTNHVVTTRGSDLLVEYAVDYKNPKSISQRVSFPYVRSKLRKALREASFMTCTSTRQLEVIREIRQKKEFSEVIRTGVDESRFEFSPKENGSSNVFFCPRSMKSIYNHKLLLHSFDVFLQSCESQDFELRLIDDIPNSSYSAEIRSYCKTLRCAERVSFLASMSPEEMIREYTASDIVIMIPKSDGTPVSAIEAMMIGRPVILGPLMYDEDLFSEDQVFKAESFAVDSIAAVMRRAVDSKSHPEMLSAARDAAVQNAGLSNSLKRVSSIYNELTDGKL